MNIIINADDFGRSSSVNRAICKAFEDGIIHRTTIMVNMPKFEEAVEQSIKYGFFERVGLHLNLDDGDPLSEEMKNNATFCKDGHFKDYVFHGIKNRLFLNDIDRKALYNEISAQFAKYLNVGFPLKHFDSHHFVHNNLSVLSLAVKVAKDYNFISVRKMEVNRKDSLPKAAYKKLVNSYLSSHFHTTDFFVQKYENLIDTDKIVEFMVHPDFRNENLVDIISWAPEETRDLYEYKKLFVL